MTHPGVVAADQQGKLKLFVFCFAKTAGVTGAMLEFLIRNLEIIFTNARIEQVPTGWQIKID